ncbi:hypothetical protein FTE28_04680 [Bacillus licheniformis]|nr:hypothetical protein CPQ91_11085 [Bacillus licheniformis]AUZ30905.1 hypothetical protein C1T27_11285 [Bacillus licheniformis]AXF88980.1 hypothetical protein BLDA23_12040 [Bacillus licheniformis]AYC51833.1 hypothetical protein C7M53_11250 [Bacillus licheniformis]KAA0812978.1 hypothetical protein EI978_07405 [Bacillus licheniformis]
MAFGLSRFFYIQTREKSDKKGDKIGDFFFSTLSYDRDKKTNVEYRVQDGEPADTDLLHTDVMRLIGLCFQRARLLELRGLPMLKRTLLQSRK